MLNHFSDVLWRALMLVLLAIAPYAAPLSVGLSASTAAALLRLVVAAALLGLGALSILRLAKTRSVAALLAGGALLLAAIAAAAEWPTPPARSVWIVGPLLWTGLAVGLGPRLASARPIQFRGLQPSAAWATLVAGVGVLSFGLAWPRIGSRTAMVRGALASSPGNEAAALEEALTLQRNWKTDEAQRVLEACATHNPAACECFAQAARQLRESRNFPRVLEMLRRADASCLGPEVEGMRAEALAEQGRVDEALRVADEALSRDNNAQSAHQAKALVLGKKGQLRDAVEAARRAVALHGGPRAQALLGDILYELGDFQGADAAYQAALQDSPKDTHSLLQIAVIAERRDQYHDAREGYLHVLRVDPGCADARYHLVVLTHGAGATAEAKHHLEELIKIAPNDARVPALTQQLAK